MEEIEREFNNELADALQNVWLDDAARPPDHSLVQTE
jgi:hypothetical protein